MQEKDFSLSSQQNSILAKFRFTKGGPLRMNYPCVYRVSFKSINIIPVVNAQTGHPHSGAKGNWGNTHFVVKFRRKMCRSYTMAENLCSVRPSISYFFAFVFVHSWAKKVKSLVTRLPWGLGTTGTYSPTTKHWSITPRDWPIWKGWSSWLYGIDRLCPRSLG